MYLTCWCYFIMCFCDGYSFVVINTITGEKQFIEGDETLCEFFETLTLTLTLTAFIPPTIEKGICTP